MRHKNATNGLYIPERQKKKEEEENKENKTKKRQAKVGRVKKNTQESGWPA